MPHTPILRVGLEPNPHDILIEAVLPGTRFPQAGIEERGISLQTLTVESAFL